MTLAISEMNWSPKGNHTYHVRSPWWELLWHPVRGLTQIQFGPSTWQAPAILGLAQICTRQQTWPLHTEIPADVVIQENRITASWFATPTRPVELHARWILEGCRFWLEISLLTPARLAGLSLETRTELGETGLADMLDLHPQVLANRLHPRAAPDWTYLQLAHRRDVSDVFYVQPGVVHWRLFHEDLEKGVVLRTQLLATFVRRDQEAALAPAIAQEFAHSFPSLRR